MHLKLITLDGTQARRAQRRPKGRRGLPLRALLVGDGDVVDGLDVRGALADLLHRGDEALGARVQQVLRLRAALARAKGRGLGVLGGREARGFAEGDEPYGEARVRDAVEDAGELA